MHEGRDRRRISKQARNAGSGLTEAGRVFRRPRVVCPQIRSQSRPSQMLQRCLACARQSPGVQQPTGDRSPASLAKPENYPQDVEPANGPAHPAPESFWVMRPAKGSPPSRLGPTIEATSDHMAGSTCQLVVLLGPSTFAGGRVCPQVCSFKSPRFGSASKIPQDGGTC